MTIDRHNSLGCRRDWHDPRDAEHAYRPQSHSLFLRARPDYERLPIDLRPRFGPPRDQMQTSGCVGFAVSAAFKFLFPDKAPLSPWFAYYGGRRRGRCVGWDAGCSIRDCLKELRHLGIPPESECEFPVQYAEDPENGSWEQAKALGMPLDAAFDAALPLSGCSYHRVSHHHILDCLAEGFPVIAGIPVYESAFTAEVERTGVLPIPQSDDPLAGGHAILIVGRKGDDWIFRNSWDGWGDGGYGYLAEAHPLADCDFWTVRKPETGFDGCPA